MKLHELATSKLTLTFGHINPDGMTKLDMDTLIGKDVTITDFDFTTDPKTQEAFAVMTIKEAPNCFVFCGKVLTDLLSAVAADEEAHNELLSDGLKVRLSTAQVKDSKRTYTKVDLVD